MRIYKYPLTKATRNRLELPIGASILKVDIQKEEWMLWAMVEPEQKIVKPLLIETYGTGHDIEKPEELTHLGTFFDGPFVWHSFIRREI